MNLSYVHFYSSTLMTSFLLRDVSAYLHKYLPLIDVDVKPSNLYKTQIDDYHKENLINQRFHNCTVGGYNNTSESQNSSNNNCPKMTIIDGFYLQRIYSKIIDENESHLSHIHIVFEDNLICTYDTNDNKYHARPIICGTPSIISIPSIIEGPAKPKGYYFKQMLKDLLSISGKEIEKEFSGTFISYDDPRLMQVTTGYVMQAIFFFLTHGNPFCSQYPCRLFNSHWQEELIHTQILNPSLCEEHLRLLDEATRFVRSN